MLRWANSKPWMWSWVVAELISPGLHHDHPSQARVTAGSSVYRLLGPVLPLCSWWGVEPTLTLWQLVRDGSSSPLAEPLGPALHWYVEPFLPELMRGGDISTQPSDISMSSGGSPDQGHPCDPQLVTCTTDIITDPGCSKVMPLATALSLRGSTCHLD